MSVGTPVGRCPVGVHRADQPQVDAGRQRGRAQPAHDPHAGPLVAVDAADHNRAAGRPVGPPVHRPDRPALHRRTDDDCRLVHRGRPAAAARDQAATATARQRRRCALGSCDARHRRTRSHSTGHGRSSQPLSARRGNIADRDHVPTGAPDRGPGPPGRHRRAGPRCAAPGRAGDASPHRAVDRIGLLQIDSVNVLPAAHYLPLFCRLGAVRPRRCSTGRAAGHRAGWSSTGRTWPAWSRPTTHPLLRWRMEPLARGRLGQHAARSRPSSPELVQRRPRGAARTGGPMTAGRGRGRAGPRRCRGTDQWGWNWSMVKEALEYLFFAGVVSSAGRTTSVRAPLRRHRAGAAPGGRSRHPTPTDEEAFRRADPDRGPGARRRRPSRACATTSGYAPRTPSRRSPSWSTPATCCRSRSRAGGRPAYLHRDARRAAPGRGPRAARAVRPAGLAPRAGRAPLRLPLPDRDLRAAEKRVHGYYVLPFLLGDRLVARVDLKADRQAGAACCVSVRVRRGARAAGDGRRAGGRARDDGRLAGSGGRRVEPRGDLAPALCAELR